VSLAGRDFTAEFPFTIDVEVVGEPQAGPAYADGVTWSVAEGTVGGPTAEESPTPEAEGDEPGPTTEAPREESATLRTLGGAAGGIAGLAVLVAAFLLWRRRAGGA